MSEQFVDRKEFLGFSGRVVILGGPNGSGKDTQEAMLTDRLGNSRRIVRHITRQPTNGETHGVDYYFVDEQAFNEMRTKGEFIESAEYPGVMSGTTHEEIVSKVRQAQFATITMNFQDGLILADRLEEAGIPSVSLFVGPCSEDEMVNDPDMYLDILFKRMSGRGRLTDHVEGRLFMAAKFRDLYLANSHRVIYIDNGNDKQESAHETIKIAIAADF